LGAGITELEALTVPGWLGISPARASGANKTDRQAAVNNW